ncbi:MAG: 2-succinyl-5-enolpyruvyl-6-hydroxy-3-cyclohexene-1-carboxylic-acid synthase [Ignavibacteria bacterium]
MKIKINRNILWARTFVRELASLGVKHACISPGSRNTPLTLAFAECSEIVSYVHIDERSCGFFALGIAKAVDSPVAIVTTSGTAVSELYPAIIEAFYQRVPLIVCTADRPPEHLDCGANQTINQNNIFKNHIRWFIDTGIPEPIIKRIKHIKIIARKAYHESLLHSKGPVHINFPLRKPFEPDSFTDEVNKELVDFAENNFIDKKIFFKEKENIIENEKWFREIFNLLKKYSKGIILAGPESYNPQFRSKCGILSEILSYPVLADGASHLRFGDYNKTNILSGFEGLLRSKEFEKNLRPEIIIQFGRTMTSKALDDYLENCSAQRFMINEFGDWFDPSNRSIASFPCKPHLFCEKMITMLRKNGFKRNGNEWLNMMLKANEISCGAKNKIIEEIEELSEPGIIKELLDILPDETQLMISNSMPIRDFDYFAPLLKKNIIIYNNRGASGIDGITSTALGIASVNKKTTLLLTGDLAFYYDLTGLLAAKKYSIPIIIVIINNNGGGIFEVLPVSKYLSRLNKGKNGQKIFKNYFITPHDLDFAPFVKGFGGNYYLARNKDNFKESLCSALKSKIFSVIEIQTNAAESLRLRNKYWEVIDRELNKKLIQINSINP